MLPLLREQQNDVCKGFWSSEILKDGKPVNLCPWGCNPVPEWAQQVDHIIRVADGGSDDLENLQMLCACCHAGKTASESGAKSIGRAVTKAVESAAKDAAAASAAAAAAAAAAAKQNAMSHVIYPSF